MTAANSESHITSGSLTVWDTTDFQYIAVQDHNVQSALFLNREGTLENILGGVWCLLLVVYSTAASPAANHRGRQLSWWWPPNPRCPRLFPCFPPLSLCPSLPFCLFSSLLMPAFLFLPLIISSSALFCHYVFPLLPNISTYILLFLSFFH